MPLHLRLTILILSSSGFILWFVWVLTGFVEERFRGAHDVFGALLQALIPVSLMIGVSGNSIPRHIWKRLCRLWRQRRKTNLPKHRLAQAIGAWAAFLIGVMILAFYGKDIGTWGDSFNILTCLFLAVGFYYTVKQIQHTEETTTKASRTQADMWRSQRLESKIVSLRSEESNLRNRLDRVHTVMSSLGSLATGARHFCESGNSQALESWNFKEAMGDFVKILELVEVGESIAERFGEISDLLTRFEAAKRISMHPLQLEIAEELIEHAMGILESSIGPTSMRLETRQREIDGQIRHIEHILDTLLMRA